MNKTAFFTISLVAVSLGLFLSAASASGATFDIQTNSAANIFSNQATLNANLTNFSWSFIDVWFEWRTDTTYNNQSSKQQLNYTGSFSREITGLFANTTYYFRAVGQSVYGEKIYGQGMTFYTGSSSVPSGLTISKKVINLTSGNLNWQNSVSARPLDILSFAITLQTGNQQIDNIFVRDILPQNLIYKGNLTLNASLNYSQNPSSGIYIGTIPANGIYVISYQAQVSSAQNFAFGTTTLNNTATITSDQFSSQTANSYVFVNNSSVSGATYVPTGITNNPITDSFFLPLFIIISMFWLYFSGRIYKLADWLKNLKSKA